MALSNASILMDPARCHLMHAPIDQVPSVPIACGLKHSRTGRPYFLASIMISVLAASADTWDAVVETLTNST